MKHMQGEGWRITLARLAWSWTWLLLFRPTPRWAMHRWRRFLLRAFGARLGKGAIVRPSCRIGEPWNLTMGALACLADNVECDCVAPVSLGNKATVSQNSLLCTATRELDGCTLKPVARPIVIGAHVWVAADAFIGTGVRIGTGAVVGACTVVNEDVAPWSIVGGNPARFIKPRRQERWTIRTDAAVPGSPPDANSGLTVS